MSQESTESLELAIMMSCHCAFLLLIVIVDHLSVTLYSGVCDSETSFIMNLDSLVSLNVYFSPKICANRRKMCNQEYPNLLIARDILLPNLMITQWLDFKIS